MQLWTEFTHKRNMVRDFATTLMIIAEFLAYFATREYQFAFLLKAYIQKKQTKTI